MEPINKTALVTGAAMGIGRALCHRLAKDGWHICMVDVNADELAITQNLCETAGPGQIIAETLDISSEEAITALKAKLDAKDHFKTVHMLINNAATRIGRGFDASLDEWRALTEVNLWGAIALTHAFLPDMLASKTTCRIINVGSKQGITNPPGHPVYNFTKAALKSYTESLQHELRTKHADSKVTAHLLVPGWTTTQGKEHQQGAWLPEQVADFMFDALAQDTFYIICPDDEVSTEMDNKRIIWGAEDITKNRPPLSRWHPDFKEEASKACS